MQKNVIGLVLGLTLLLSCSKSNSSSGNSIVGTWIFRDHLTQSFAYPSVLANNPFPIGNSTASTTADSTLITFDNSGNYTFQNYRHPDDKGKYSIAQDSFLIIKPDTADFVKFNYTLQTFTFTTGTGLPPDSVLMPYSDFRFSTDTILFKKSTDNNNIFFSGAWLTKADRPIIPGNDTLILNESFNHFTRQ